MSPFCVACASRILKMISCFRRLDSPSMLSVEATPMSSSIFFVFNSAMSITVRPLTFVEVNNRDLSLIKTGQRFERG